VGKLRLNLSNRVQLGASLTVQESTYDQPVYWSAGMPPSTNYLRTPDIYGSFAVDFNATKALKLSLSGISTGAMNIPHLAGYIEQDVLERSDPFLEINFKAAYNFQMLATSGITLFAGVQNIFNQYQTDFDKYKARDSNYVYGPARPRTVFVGAELSL
jgi:outer membrane receptor for ferrienterochelin and colicins